MFIEPSKMEEMRDGCERLGKKINITFLGPLSQKKYLRTVLGHTEKVRTKEIMKLERS